ncbi:hypothetical protein A8U91_02303 [Halomonas elongata]|uniref:Uncharacterized protein n=1 Tax=Halomonas elongata TaxID=2746 RepID=A0A1B8P6M9_HALEL|nr:hypothetical protein [Halomonas elongata]OBX37924.1 hypothetical protein A8U91_02303 [Halomonas elongata]
MLWVCHLHRENARYVVPDLQATPRGGNWPVVLGWLGVILLVVAVALMGAAGPAYRLEWLSLGTSFTLLRQGAHLALGPACWAC